MTGTRKRYDAFLSYSHGPDSDIADTLQRALESYAKPWYRAKAVRIFRDVAELTPGTDISTTIGDALGQSAKLILLASPESAQSPWVGHELRHWIERQGERSLLIALTAGEIHWDDKANDFDWERTTALPRALQGLLSGEPLYVDMRWARDRPRLSLSQPDFHDAVTMLAAAVHGRPREELLSEEVERGRQKHRVLALAVFGMVSLTTGALSLTYTALRTKTASPTPSNITEAPIPVNLRLQEDRKDAKRWDLVMILPEEIPYYRGAAISAHLSLAEAGTSTQLRRTVTELESEASTVCVEASTSSFSVSHAQSAPCERLLPIDSEESEVWHWTIFPKADVVGVQDILFTVTIAPNGNENGKKVLPVGVSLFVDKGLLDRYPGVAAALLGAIAAIGAALTGLLGQALVKKDKS